MTIEEAIKHCEDVANNSCDECAKEHAQLAEWLKELKISRLKIKMLMNLLDEKGIVFGSKERDEFMEKIEKQNLDILSKW